MKVAITTTSFGKYDRSPLDRLDDEKITYVLNTYDRKLVKEEVIDLAKGVTGIIAGTEPLNDWVLNNLPELKVISRCGAGLDNVDLVVAERLGIKVVNTPYGPTLAVAELTIGIILGLLRKISKMDRELRLGIWKKQMGNLLFDKKLGIVGFGRIGQKVAELAIPFGVEIGYHDTCDVSYDLPCKAYNFDDLLAWADIILLHLSSPKDTGPIIKYKDIKKMKQGAWLINMSRGGLIDEDALYSALKENHLAGAALDVFSDEPYNGKLKTLNNIVLTPHTGSYAMEARAAMEIQAVENLIKGLKSA